MEKYMLKVINNKNLVEYLPAELTELEGNYNFKPHVGVLSDGEILMFVSHNHAEEDITGGTLAVHPVIYRSSDGGKTWSKGRHIPEMIGGHEPAVSVIDDVLFVTTHFYKKPDNDPHTGKDYTYCVIYRSEDGGNTFNSIYIKGSTLGGKNENVGQTSRNVIRLKSERLIFGIDYEGDAYILYSDDMGKTWENKAVIINNVSGENIMGENVFFYSPTGRLMMLARLDYTKIKFKEKIACMPEYDRETGLDQFDGEILFESKDNGLTWEPLRAVGFPALMYPSIVNLKGNKQLFTYTVREIPPEGTGCIYPKVGVQAIIIEEKKDGFMDFNFQEDVIIIDDCTPRSQRNAGCFGNTIQLADGTLVTPYSFPKIDSEILELANNKEFLKPEVFNKYAEMQTTYSFRYEDFINEDKDLMEMNLQRCFSAMFLYAQCVNKGGIGTRVARWKLGNNVSMYV